VDLSLDRARDEGGDWVYGQTALPAWAKVVQQAARRAFRETTGSLDTSARGLKAVARAEREFERRLGGIIGEHGQGASLAMTTDNAESEVGT
jgi:hypothetical protein